MMKKKSLKFDFAPLIRSKCVFTMIVISTIILGITSIKAYADDPSADATYWQGPANSAADWFSGSNWDKGVPGSSNDAYIKNGGIAEITSGTAVAHYIELGSYFSDGHYVLKGGTLDAVDLSGTDGSTVEHTGGLSTLQYLWGVGNYNLSQANANMPSSLTTGISVIDEGQTFTQSGGEHNATQQYVFSQYTLSGGINTIQRLGIYDQGIYRVTGGSLIAGDVYVGGEQNGSGTLEVASGCTVSVKDGFFQHDTIRVFEDSLVDLTQGGKVLVGNVDTGLTGAITIGIDGAFEGTGTIIGNMSNQGIVRSGLDIVGHYGYLPGTLTITGDYEQESNGILALFMTGSDAGSFSQISIDGQAYLAGELSLSLIDGFIPNIGDTFEILNASSCYGNFSLINVIGLPDDMFFDIEYGGSKVVLEVVPEPATLTLLGLGGLFLIKNKLRTK